jgi:hypothetical protein
MPKNKKQPKDMTTEELAKRVFPKKILEHLKKIVHEKDDKPDVSSQQI